LHRIIAERLLADPEHVLAVARDNLRRWQSAGVQPYYERWSVVLEDWPAERIAAAITADDEVGRSLRQSTPFAGVLGTQERDDIIRETGIAWRARRVERGELVPLPDMTDDEMGEEAVRAVTESRRRRIPHMRTEAGISREEQARIGARDHREPQYRRLPVQDDEAYGDIVSRDPEVHSGDLCFEARVYRLRRSSTTSRAGTASRHTSTGSPPWSVGRSRRS